MSRSSRDPEEQGPAPDPARIWETLPAAHRQALVALLAVCLIRQMMTLMPPAPGQEVPHEPSPRR
jgi:hypothetical protein